MTNSPQASLLPEISLDEVRLSTKELSELYGVDVRTVQLWDSERRWIERDNKGNFHLPSVVRSVYRAQLDLINRKKGADGEVMGDLEVREQRAKTEMAELRVREMRGTVVSAEDVKKAAFETARSVRDALSAIPARIGALVAAESDPHKVKEILAQEIRQALEELAQ